MIDLVAADPYVCEICQSDDEVTWIYRRARGYPCPGWREKPSPICKRCRLKMDGRLKYWRV